MKKKKHVLVLFFACQKEFLYNYKKFLSNNIINGIKFPAVAYVLGSEQLNW